MDKKQDTQNAVKAATKKFQSSAQTIEVEIEEKPGRHTPAPCAVDRPGFDIGGSTGGHWSWIGSGCRRKALGSKPARTSCRRHAFNSALERPDAPGAPIVRQGQSIRTQKTNS